MDRIDDGGPAFPTHEMQFVVNGEGYEVQPQSGMTVRDYFAGKSLQGMAARDDFDPGLDTPEKRANVAYLEADAMIQRRKR